AGAGGPARRGRGGGHRGRPGGQPLRALPAGGGDDRLPRLHGRGGGRREEAREPRALPQEAGGGPGPVSPRAGFVSVVGRPNVGKSTLVNRLVGQKVAIVSDKPQTTRNRILAVVNRPGGQIVLFDTPGIHKPQHRMNQRMVDTAIRSLAQVEVVLWLADVTDKPGPGERVIQQAV